MKKCSKCKEIKTRFSPDKRSKDGLYSQCRDCMVSLYRTKHGCVTKIYSRQLQSSRLRGHSLPKYTRVQLLEWVLKQKSFHNLHKKWVLNNYDSEYKPSVDRIDDYKGYSFDNIQLMTWKENRHKANMDRVNGLNNKLSKSVKQCDKNGNIIKIYHSMRQAERETGIGSGLISNFCKGISNNGGGFIWIYT